MAGRNDIYEDFRRNTRTPYLITLSVWRQFLRRIVLPLVTRPPGLYPDVPNLFKSLLIRANNMFTTLAYGQAGLHCTMACYV